MDNTRETLDSFKKAVGEIWMRDGENTWPIEINTIVHLFMDIFQAELAGDIEKLKAQGLSDADIAAKFRTSARIIRLIMPCVQGMKARGVTMEKQREQILYYLTLVGHLKKGDLFNRDGKNIILSPAQFEAEVKPENMRTADIRKSAKVHKLCAILWNYAESVCFKTHGLIREFHGPYGFPGSDGEILIRDFISLDALELWEECRAVKYGKIRVIAAYENLGMNVDIYSNVFIKEGAAYISSLKTYRIEADGRELEIEEADELADTLADIMIDITTRIEDYDWRQLADKYAEIFWFSKKEMCQQQERDWRVPDTVKERIRTGKIDTRLEGLTQRELQRMLRIAF
ncbi:MAG: hypothetical protein GY757_51485 [bacterium]|nr:hypothetical protein [bacterium]